MQFSNELLHVSMQTRLYHQPFRLLSASERLFLLHFWIVVEGCSIRAFPADCPILLIFKQFTLSFISYLRCSLIDYKGVPAIQRVFRHALLHEVALYIEKNISIFIYFKSFIKTHRCIFIKFVFIYFISIF